jgi:hypothetical protein
MSDTAPTESNITYDWDDPDSWPVGQFTCHVEGCENENLPIDLEVPGEPSTYNVICGACMQPIVDRVKVDRKPRPVVLPEPPEEPSEPEK